MAISIKRTYNGREWTFYKVTEDGNVTYVRRRMDSGDIDVSRDGQKWLRVSPEQRNEIRNAIDEFGA